MDFSLASGSSGSFELKYNGRYAFQKINESSNTVWCIKPTILAFDVTTDCSICYETKNGTQISGLPCCPVLICTECCSKGLIDPRCPFCRTDLSDPFEIALKRSNDDERKRKRCDNDENTDPNPSKRPSSPLSVNFLQTAPPSPPYSAFSPVHAPESPRYSPPSPPYSASSPVYAPESPRYSPPSPPYCPFSAAYFHCTCGNCSANAQNSRETASTVQNLEHNMQTVSSSVNAMQNFIRIVTDAPDSDFQRVLREELVVLRNSLPSQTTLNGDDTSIVEV